MSLWTERNTGTQAGAKCGPHPKFYHFHGYGKGQILEHESWMTAHTYQDAKKKKIRIRQKQEQNTHSERLTKEGSGKHDDRRDRKVYKQTGFFFFCLSLSFASLSRLASRLLNSSGIFS